LVEEFGSHVVQTSIVDEYRESFAVGASTDTLSDHDRAIYAAGVAALNRAASANKPTCEAAFRAAYDATPARLDVVGRTQEDSGSYHLTRDQQDFFATYGVLPPVSLDAVSSELLDSVDRLCCGLVTHGSGLNGVSSTPAWIFDRDLLTLATHPQIVETVASLIGDQLTFLGSDGPMFLPPSSPQKTAWHAFDASHFGGGGSDSNLQQVTAWVALSDATTANGCMRIAPGTFRAFAALNEVTPKFYGADVSELIELFAKNESKVDPAIAARIVCRHLNDKNFPTLMRLGSSKDSPEGYRYNPFHAAVDKAWCVGERDITVLDEGPKVVMEAKRKQAYFFTSQNAHASLMNTTGGWRKAIAFRYVKTAKAAKSIITQATHRLRGYLDMFPGTNDVLAAVNRSVETFEDAAPRLCVRGSIPAGQEQFYFDQKQLLSELAKRGGSCLPRIEPLPTA
jgi:ectoine hydroxylase-related dioxygenase (phytanoyl-CoA dioxygenase family)